MDPTKHIAPLLALLLLLLPAGGADAQAFGSISSMGTGQGGMAPSGSFASALAARPARNSSFATADRIVVKKGERKLYLLRSSEVIAEYPVKLGLNPYGRKEQEGDFRTPEGTYQLVRRNPRSEFFLALEVSYPNETDRARARARGVPPGGLIMIHGQPNVLRKSPEYYARNDWTNGCIAVSNSDMVDIWLRTGVGTPIEIHP
jgi:murein L,D-transpeptidase YafK